MSTILLQHFTSVFVRAASSILVALSLGIVGGFVLPLAAAAPAAHGVERIHALVVHPQGETLVAGTDLGLFHSQDGGRSWAPLTPQGEVPSQDFTALVAYPRQPNLLYASGPELGIVRSDDFGRTWQRANAGLPSHNVPALTIDPHKPTQLYAWVDGQKIYRSQDRGNSWQPRADGPATSEVRVLTSVNISTGMGGIFLYAGTADGVFRSPD